MPSYEGEKRKKEAKKHKKAKFKMNKKRETIKISVDHVMHNALNILFY